MPTGDQHKACQICGQMIFDFAELDECSKCGRHICRGCRELQSDTGEPICKECTEEEHDGNV